MVIALLSRLPMLFLSRVGLLTWVRLMLGELD